MFFASDNGGPAAPEVIAAISRANQGAAMPYGADPIMDSVRKKIREIFEAPEAVVFLVATGTAANALALASLVQPWQTIFCHRIAHIEEDECGAPEFYTGGSKLTLLDGENGKIDPEGLSNTIAYTGRAGVHNVQKGALSLTNATEAGTVYTVEEVTTLCNIAKKHDLPCHMDGARFANALVRLGCTPAELTWKAGIDVLCFGGTKNGLLGVEAVIWFNPKPVWEFELRRKRGGHLFSKHRFLSAQMDSYLTDDLWAELARKANRAADRLAEGILQVPGASLIHPVEANAIFARWPRKGHVKAQEAGAKYYHWPFDQPLVGPPDDSISARLVCNWATTDAEIDAFLRLIS